MPLYFRLLQIHGRFEETGMVDQRRSELLQRVFIEYRYAAVLADPARLAGWCNRELTMSQLRVLFILNGDPGMTAANEEAP